MDLYELLGIGREASEAEIRRAYQKRARVLHPHLNPGDPEAAGRFEAVAGAFRLLSDPKQRAAYDRGPGDPSRGEDVLERARLEFDESFHGTTRRLRIERYESCATCSGSGEVAAVPAACSACRGTGQVRGRRGHMIFSRACGACGGAGTLRQRPCDGCQGEGRVPGAEDLEVRIPAGARSGGIVRLPGCGHAGRRGGPPGDLLLHIEAAPHPRFHREGDDLEMVVPISIVEAAMGGHVEVETPDGSVAIEVPAGTQTGHRFRLRKRGMPRLGQSGRGDLYVEVRVSVPTVTDDEGRALLKRFADAHPQSREALHAALEEAR
jgi:molecular chaperone DnaJ